MLKEEIKEILYSDTGMYEKFRNHGDFGCITDEIKEKLIKYADEVEKSIDSDTPDVEGLQILIGVLDFIHSLDFAKDNEEYEKYKEDYNKVFIQISGKLLI